MKKVILSIIIWIVLLPSTHAQNTFPATGNAGIGTSTPTAIQNYTVLDMVGKSSSNGGYIRFATSNALGEARIFNSNDRLIFDLLKSGMYFQWRNYNDKEIFRVNENGSAYLRGNQSSYTEIASNGDGQYMRQFGNNGTQVSWLIRGYALGGIQAQFNHGGIEVNGNIRAKEIKVETANWPDYVFANDYQLPDLKETEAFIRENKHLPGMPTAAEVTANGISLGEMNRKLLEKVEELTLHLIEKDKTEQLQNERISNLERLLEIRK